MKDHEKLWQRLERLLQAAQHASSGLRPGRSGVERLSPEEVGELSRLYRAATTHLAQAQTFGASARRLRRLNHLVARAHAVVYRQPARRGSLRLVALAFLQFPVVIRRTLRFHLVAALLLGLGGLYGFFGALEDPEWALLFVAREDNRTPFADREELLETLLAGREGHASVSAGEKTHFATFLWVNNTRVALLSFFSGLCLGIPTVALLLFNGALLGVYTATFHRHALAFEWWAWILPHGVTELLAIVLLSGGGLYIGGTVLNPGTRSRREALGSIRAEVLQLVLFAFPMLLLAALIESFVRQSNLGDPGRYLFALATAVFWVVYLACVRPPSFMRAAEKAQETVAEARIPVPREEELLNR